MGQCCNAKTRPATIAGALWEAVVIGLFLAFAVNVGHAAAGWILAQDPNVTHLRHIHRLDVIAHERTAYTAAIAYFVAATLVGAGFLVHRLPQRVMIPLGSPIAWFLLLVFGFLAGIFVLPFVVLWRFGGLLWVIAAPSARAAPTPPPNIVNVTAPPAQVYLVDREGMRLAQPEDLKRAVATQTYEKLEA